MESIESNTFSVVSSERCTAGINASQIAVRTLNEPCDDQSQSTGKGSVPHTVFLFDKIARLLAPIHKEKVTVTAVRTLKPTANFLDSGILCSMD